MIVDKIIHENKNSTGRCGKIYFHIYQQAAISVRLYLQREHQTAKTGQTLQKMIEKLN